MGKLSLVSTPIGNLEDISIRAMKILMRSDAIACEDTRRTGLLLKFLDEKYHQLIFPDGEIFKRPELVSYHEHNELMRIPQIINGLKNGLNIALVSDAGTPAVSDPGFKLVRECIKEGINIESIPGASSVISALIISGLPTDKFLFTGYPPKKPGHRVAFFEKLKSSQSVLSTTIIMFESPHKLITTLKDLQLVFGDIEVVICRELTKIYESKRREKISQSIIHYQLTKPRGEYVLLFNISRH